MQQIADWLEQLGMQEHIQRFAENETFPHVFQPKMVYPPVDDAMKGRWNELFFKNQNPIVLELGCGAGLVATAATLAANDRRLIDARHHA